MGRARAIRLLERSVIVVVSLGLSISVIALLSGGLLAGHDQPGVSGVGGEPGVQYRDLGDARLAAGQPRPVYDSQPPTSGPHIPATVQGDEAELSDDQLLQALAVGDVVIMYGTRSPPGGLRKLALEVAPPFTPALAAVGQAVILARRPGTAGLVAAAWTRLAAVSGADDPLLRQFIGAYLGRGAPGR
jgi:hypothetical protein